MRGHGAIQRLFSSFGDGGGSGSSGGPSRKLKAWRAEPEIGLTPAPTRSPTALNRPEAASSVWSTVSVSSAWPTGASSLEAVSLPRLDHLPADPGGGGRGLSGQVERGLGGVGQGEAQRPVRDDGRREDRRGPLGRLAIGPVVSPEPGEGERRGDGQRIGGLDADGTASASRPGSRGARGDRQGVEPLDRVGRRGRRP